MIKIEKISSVFALSFCALFSTEIAVNADWYCDCCGKTHRDTRARYSYLGRMLGEYSLCSTSGCWLSGNGGCGNMLTSSGGCNLEISYDSDEATCESIKEAAFKICCAANCSGIQPVRFENYVDGADPINAPYFVSIKNFDAGKYSDFSSLATECIQCDTLACYGVKFVIISDVSGTLMALLDCAASRGIRVFYEGSGVGADVLENIQIEKIEDADGDWPRQAPKPFSDCYGCNGYGCDNCYGCNGGDCYWCDFVQVKEYDRELDLMI